METCFCIKGILLFFEFKSYYVVWKLHRCTGVHCENNSLNRTMQYGNIYLLAGYFLKNKRLNRTMQYGNWLGKHTVLKQLLSLNRTMQYGNLLTAIGLFRIVEFKSYYVVWKLNNNIAKIYIAKSLNRTMQYGNDIARRRYDDMWSV